MCRYFTVDQLNYRLHSYRFAVDCFLSETDAIALISQLISGAWKGDISPIKTANIATGLTHVLQTSRRSWLMILKNNHKFKIKSSTY